MSTQYVGTVLGDSPQAYYRLDEASGTIAYDASENGYNGTISGSGVTYSQTGAITEDTDKALLFDGVAGDISLPSSLNPSGWGAISVELWIYAASVAFASSPAAVANAIPATSNTGVSLWFDSAGGGVNFVVGNGTTNGRAHAVQTLSTNTWYHVVGTWDGTTITIYVNGVSKATASLSGTVGASGNNLFIAHNPAGTDYFPGVIDEVSIYNVALTGTQVANHYNTAIAVLTTLNLIPTNTRKRVIQAEDVNQLINTLQQPSGGQEKGHYFLEVPGYVANATSSFFIPSLSGNSTPVSVTVDAADQANSGYTNSVPGVDHQNSFGFNVYEHTNGIQPNPTIGGNYTIQY